MKSPAVIRFARRFFLVSMVLFSCSFDYSDSGVADDNEPDIVMEKVEYTRFRDGELDLRFSAEEARRYEKKQLMELNNFFFEQYAAGASQAGASQGGENQAGETQGGEGGDPAVQADVIGSGGSAVIELGPGNVRISDGVRVQVDSEDMRIETSSLSWKDEDRLLESGQGGQVLIERSDGTMMKGRSFSADTRRKTWEFADGIEGTYVHEEEESGDPPDDVAADTVEGEAADEEAASTGE
jgi:hypothetical protein